MNKIIIAALALQFIIFLNAGAQTSEKQVSPFGSRMNNPVETEVLVVGNTIEFYGINKSFFPYYLTLTFEQVDNIKAFENPKSILLKPGRTKIFTLHKLNEDRQHYYSYRMAYRIGNPHSVVNENHVYLVPVKDQDKITMSYGQISLSKGDTIYAARKGYVTSIPETVQLDRVSRGSNLEIMHPDGSIGVYYDMDPFKKITPYDNIYPGQPIGIVMEDQSFGFRVFEIMEFGVVPLPFQIHTSEGKVNWSQLDGKKSDHPQKLVELELTKREKKKLNAGKLY